MTNEFFFKEDATFCEFLVAKYQFLIKWTRKYKNAKKTIFKIFYQNSETVELFVLRTRTHTFFLEFLEDLYPDGSRNLGNDLQSHLREPLPRTRTATHELRAVTNARA